MRPLLLVFALLSPAFAGPENLRPVRCRFLGFGGTDSSATVLALTDKGADIRCPLSIDSISEPLVCFAAENKISFLSPTDRKPAVMATIPAEVKNALLVFVSNPTTVADTPSWRVLVIEDTPKNFPDGGAFIANFYNKDIRFIIGEHKGMLHPAGNHGYALPTERDAFNMAPVIFEFLQDDKWRTANESSLRFLPGMRYLMFAYVDPGSGRPRISTFQDFAPATPAAP